jgi:peptide/nickel transport system ATP-binding protein
LWRKKETVDALDDVSLEVRTASTMAIVGESGSGKTTLALCIAGFETPDSGEIRFAGRRLDDLSGDERRQLRQSIQLVFQGSALALNPRFSALEAAREPLDIQQRGTTAQRSADALECMRLAGFDPELQAQPVLNLSGGQKQRLAIARALTLSPALLIFDESFAGLDLIAQTEILHELRALQRARALTYLFITHDLSLAAAIAEEIAVMQGGRLVETGSSAKILSAPQAVQTQALVRAMPRWFTSKAAERGG